MKKKKWKVGRSIFRREGEFPLFVEVWTLPYHERWGYQVDFRDGLGYHKFHFIHKVDALEKAEWLMANPWDGNMFLTDSKTVPQVRFVKYLTERGVPLSRARLDGEWKIENNVLIVPLRNDPPVRISHTGATDWGGQVLVFINAPAVVRQWWGWSDARPGGTRRRDTGSGNIMKGEA